MFAFLMAASLLSQPADPAGSSLRGRTALVFSTVGQSEWCPAGSLLLDLSSGEYSFIAQASRPSCSNPDLERPVRKGRLASRRLQELQVEYRRAQAEGLDTCRKGRRGEVVVSNGGDRILVLTSGVRSMAAPDELGCWTDAARALHQALSDAFSTPR